MAKACLACVLACSGSCSSKTNQSKKQKETGNGCSFALLCLLTCVKIRGGARFGTTETTDHKPGGR